MAATFFARSRRLRALLLAIPSILAGREAIEGAETVALEHIDAGKEIELVNTTISDTDALTVDHEYRITLLELGIDDTEGDAETT